VNRRQFFTRTIGAAAAVAVAPHLPAPIAVTSPYPNTAALVSEAWDAAIKRTRVEFGYGFEVTSHAQFDATAKMLAESSQWHVEQIARKAFAESV
jgi:hypothetical protein